MAWVDDRIWCHPKFVGLTPKAFRTWVHGTAYSSGFGTRGRLTLAQQATIGCTSRLRLELVVAGLWHHDEDGSVRINDWEEHNGQRDRAKELARERKRRQRERDSHADVTRDLTVTEGVTEGVTLTRAPDDGVKSEEVKEKQKQEPRAVPPKEDAQPPQIAEVIDLSLREAS